ncbi:AraC family transcriptional regulator [Pantoea rodasii]|uniref:AraC family transcriptional regulator n=1 Tax=Pantoea rodasii TaxID=1076549 RepID=A0A2M9WJ58_9GAMM|nr:helix-turn-helix transcriptional regulator [Pantoea rodasii]ORM61823.1 AraC family transcriptional regulator [Pantoea rodasii]PJZ07539.1 AraC family transcriptional regulator [Pantoea rodasii]
MRNVSIEDFDFLDRDVVAIGNDYAQGFALAPHHHRRAQLLYGATGQMHVSTRDGEWVVPPQHAVWIPPETLHAVKFVGVTTRSLYIAPACAARLTHRIGCEVIEVSPLLRQLLLDAVDLPPLYDSERERALMHLLLLELTAASAREFDIPLPRQPALRTLCQTFLLAPTIHYPAERWANKMFMSASTFRRHFLQQTGLSFSAWRQRACVVSALECLIQGKSVNEVALSLGYDNGSSFATMFRRVTGQPPSFYHPS